MAKKKKTKGSRPSWLDDDEDDYSYLPAEVPEVLRKSSQSPHGPPRRRYTHHSYDQARSEPGFQPRNGDRVRRKSRTRRERNHSLDKTAQLRDDTMIQNFKAAKEQIALDRKDVAKEKEKGSTSRENTVENNTPHPAGVNKPPAADIKMNDVTKSDSIFTPNPVKSRREPVKSNSGYKPPFVVCS